MEIIIEVKKAYKKQVLVSWISRTFRISPLCLLIRMGNERHFPMNML
jgi:hypothetical protein